MTKGPLSGPFLLQKKVTEDKHRNYASLDKCCFSKN